MGLINQWGEVAHVERLSFPASIGRPIKKRTAVEVGVDERYCVGGDGLLLRIGSKWAEGCLEAKQGQEGKVNHDGQGYDKSERGNASSKSRSEGETLYSHIRRIQSLIDLPS